MNRTDNDPSFWSFSARGVETRNLTFNVLYPTEVTNLTLNDGLTLIDGPVDQNITVDIVCKWDAGNPPVSAHLRDRHGAILQIVSDVNGEIRYRFADVGCRDAGRIRCQAQGAKHDQSATLLVRCPPELSLVTIKTHPEEEASLTVAMRAHTSLVNNCKLSKLLKPSTVGPTTDPLDWGSKSWNCYSFISLNGSPPDMTLTVALPLANKSEKAMWRLEVTNDVGTGQLEVDMTQDIPALQVISLIQSSQTPDATTHLDLEVRSHTATFQCCQLLPLQTLVTCNVTEVTGSPPDLTVSIQLNNVRKQDQRTWRLTLTNDMGDGHFCLPLKTFAAINDNDTKSSTGRGQTGPDLTAWITAVAAAIVAIAAVVFVACRFCGRNTELLTRGRSARSEECLMIHNVLYQRSASVPGIRHNEDPRIRHLPMFDINSRPPAPLPGEKALNGDYAEVNHQQEMESAGYQACASADDYVPISEIQARKRLAQGSDQSGAETETKASEEAREQASNEVTML